MFPFELLSMPDRTFNSKGLLTYLAAKAETRSGVLAEPALHYTELQIKLIFVYSVKDPKNDT